PITAITIQAQVASETPGAISNGTIILEMGDQYASSYFGVNMDCAVSNADELLPSIMIFPNPVRNDLSIASETLMDSIELYSWDGKLIHSQKYLSNRVLLDMSKMPSGIYAIRILTEKGYQLTKVQVVR
ncbi:MAG: T9SS type A sorting domain-containing protein, partial [Flavobacteriales bacterium]